MKSAESGMPADGMDATSHDGTSARPLGSSRMTLHHLPLRAEGAGAMSLPGTLLPFAAVQKYGRFLGYSGKHVHAVSLSAIDPNVWSGRAVQEDFAELVVSGL